MKQGGTGAAAQPNDSKDNNQPSPKQGETND
jgi:hypothetical protein